MAESSSSGGKNSEEEEHNEASPSPRGPVSPNTKTSEKRPGIFSSERRRRHLSQEQRRRIEQEIRGGRKPGEIECLKASLCPYIRAACYYF